MAGCVERCRSIVAQRARSAPVREVAEATSPATWSATANIALARAALELALAEMVVLRWENNGPESVPPARLRAEQDRIMELLLGALGGAGHTMH